MDEKHRTKTRNLEFRVIALTKRNILLESALTTAVLAAVALAVTVAVLLGYIFMTMG